MLGPVAVAVVVWGRAQRQTPEPVPMRAVWSDGTTADEARPGDRGER